MGEVGAEEGLDDLEFGFKREGFVVFYDEGIVVHVELLVGRCEISQEVCATGTETPLSKFPQPMNLF